MLAFQKKKKKKKTSKFNHSLKIKSSNFKVTLSDEVRLNEPAQN